MVWSGELQRRIQGIDTRLAAGRFGLPAVPADQFSEVDVCCPQCNASIAERTLRIAARQQCRKFWCAGTLTHTVCYLYCDVLLHLPVICIDALYRPILTPLLF